MADKNQEVQKVYTIQIDDNNGKLESILVEEKGGFGRWLYKREPKGMELPLTDAIFEETAEVWLDHGIFDAEKLYENLKVNDEYYANLMRKVYKNYLKRYVLTSSLHRDAFWGD